jgi:hypothetical protein
MDNNNTILILGNYICSEPCFTIENNLTLKRIHEILNHWCINERTQELDKFSNKTSMVYLDNDLVLFYNEKDKRGEYPTFDIEGHKVYGSFIIARYDEETNNFVTLTDEDKQYLEVLSFDIVMGKIEYYKNK